MSPPVEVEADVEAFELDPEDEPPDQDAGHLHVIVDHGCVDPEEVIPHDDGYVHLDDGGRTVELGLDPGTYDPCLQASDAGHVASDFTDELSITVERMTERQCKSWGRGFDRRSIESRRGR